MPKNYQLTVKRFMTRSGIAPYEVAHRMGVSRAIVLKTLESPLIPADSRWPDLLDALGIELVLRFKQPETDEPTNS